MLLYLINPALPAEIEARSRGPIYTLLDNKYYFDRFNDWFFAGGARGVRRFAVDGRRPHDHRRHSSSTARRSSSAGTAALLRHMQSGYVYHYAFTMIIGVFALLTWWAR